MRHATNCSPEHIDHVLSQDPATEISSVNRRELLLYLQNSQGGAGNAEMKPAVSMRIDAIRGKLGMPLQYQNNRSLKFEDLAGSGINGNTLTFAAFKWAELEQITPDKVAQLSETELVIVAEQLDEDVRHYEGIQHGEIIVGSMMSAIAQRLGMIRNILEMIQRRLGEKGKKIPSFPKLHSPDEYNAHAITLVRCTRQIIDRLLHRALPLAA